ncbi:MAG: glycosyltransferase [Bacilli bacterium]|jgi:glycosyltransferase involved in cell wall biosynthesis|nr:glycosyltransferase [Bacilli bacterium]
MKEIALFEDVFGLFGGIEKVILNIIVHADSKEFHFSLVVNHMASDEYLPVLKQYNVTIYELEDTWIHNPIKRHLKGYRSFRKFLKNHKFDILHFNISNSIDLKYVAIAKKEGIQKRIVHCHNDDATSSFKRFVHYFLKPFYVGYGTFDIACSDSAGRWEYSKKILASDHYQMIQNGIDTAKFNFSSENRTFLRKEFTQDDNTLLVMHVGRFNTQKNQDKVLSVFSCYHQKNPNSKLVFFGSGVEQPFLDKIESLGLTESVIIHQPTTQIADYYNAFDVFLFPSLYEGFGLVLVEAQTNGLPCLISDVIPKEPVFSPLVKRLSLSASDQEWADAMKDIKPVLHPAMGLLAKEKGYDEINQAEAVYSIYRKD